jgi:hypothetical protein
VQSGPHGSVFSLHLPVAAATPGNELLETSEQPLTSSVFDL